jgi:DNA-binding HxlR family transcriptional regulator
MLGRTYEDQVCSVARTLEIVGERWTLLIVRDALLGMRRFDEFHKSLGIARNVLSDRLGKLVERGILERVEYSERPARSEYHLTGAGRELGPIVVSLMHWGDRHAAGPDGPPRLTVHKGCGGPVAVRAVCAEHGVVPAGEVEMLPGPGLAAGRPGLSGSR